MVDFSQIVMTIGKISSQFVNMLGTGFLISNDGLIVTTRHVIGNDDKELVVLMPSLKNFNDYQDTTDNSCQIINAKVVEVDPIRDLIILKIDIEFTGILPKISGLDHVKVSEKLMILGFPHATEGRRVLTYQSTELGAKVLLGAQGTKSKYGIINSQARPGQSGSIIVSTNNYEIVGILIGAYAPTFGGGILVMGINPKELHQTTHCISSEYIYEMI